MPDHDDELMAGLIVEAKEHLEAIEPDLMGLEEDLGRVDSEAVNRIFRAVHSIKGGFGFFSMAHIEKLAHAIESVMVLVRDGQLTIEPTVVDALLAGADKLRVLIDDVHASNDISIDEEIAELATVLAMGQSPSGAQQSPLAPPLATMEAQEALQLLTTPGAECLDDASAARLGNLLGAVLEQVVGEGRPAALELIEACDMCGKAMGFDGLVREVLAEKLTALRPFLSASAAEQAGSDVAAGEGGALEEADPKAEPTPRGATLVRSLRVKVEQLDSLMNLAGELVLSRNRIKRTLGKRLSSGMDSSPQLRRFRKQLADSRERLRTEIRASGDAQAQVLSAAAGHEFDRIESSLHQLLDTSFSDLPGVDGAMQDIDVVTSELQSEIMGTRMQSVGSVFAKFPRVIRDMNRKLGKRMELHIEGENVELDKSIIEALGDPLTHLIRNSADHGIEGPDERKAAGKLAKGRIDLLARYEGGQVFIEIVDDGAGIDPERLKERAIEKGMLTATEAKTLSPREALHLIFAPGFSTASQVTDVSGRGVGMDVVRSNIEKIGGAVDIESTVGQGSRIILRLPLTLAIMSGLVIEAENRVFAIPQVDIEELVRIRARDVAERIESLHGGPVMRLRERVLPLISLNDVLGIESTYLAPEGERTTNRRDGILERRSAEISVDEDASSAENDPSEEADRRSLDTGRRRDRCSAFNIVVLRVGHDRYGLIVERLMDSEEIVVKPLPECLEACPAYAGATIMGDGRVAMILDAVGMAESGQLTFGGDLERVEGNLAATTERDRMREKQSFLLFRNGTSEQFAINLAMVRRIEKVERSAISQVHDKEFLRYEESSMRLLRLQDFLPVGVPEQGNEKCFVIVPKLVRHPMGIVVSNVEDVLETEAPLDRETITGTGILGSLVRDGTLIIVLDVYSLFEAAEPEIYRTSGGNGLDGKRILFAEDTEFFRSVGSSYLKQMGCDVELAFDGEDAWTKLCGGDFDLLVTDIEMPLLDGLGLTARIRASDQHSEMPIVALTSKTDEVDRQRILAAGVDAYHAKLDKESLARTIEELAAR